MMVNNKEKEILKLGLSKLNEDELDILGRVTGFSKFNIFVHSKDYFITMIIDRIYTNAHIDG